MTSEISTSYISRMMMGYVNGTSGGKKAGETFSATVEEQAENAAKRISKENSTVTDFKRRNPSKTKDVDQMVNAGKKVLVISHMPLVGMLVRELAGNHLSGFMNPADLNILDSNGDGEKLKVIYSTNCYDLNA